MNSLLKLLIPRIAFADLPAMIGVTIMGSLVAGLYGILHDQITYSISPEYFTNLKFAQFDYADFGLGERVFVSTIGFLATWWVGAIAAWFLGRRFIPHQLRQVAYRQIRNGIAIMIATVLLSGAIAYAYGLWRGTDADYSNWSWAIRELDVTDLPSFVRVAYIHNAGYLGGIIGFVLALIVIRPRNEASGLNDNVV